MPRLRRSARTFRSRPSTIRCISSSAPGFVRELAIEGSKAYFDTNTSNHNHFLLEPTGDLMDIPGDAIRVEGLPEPPEGMRITHVDVVVRLSKA